jgi:hypothetical protein
MEEAVTSTMCSTDQTQRSGDILKNAERKQLKVTIIIVLMTLSFYITWTPYAINSLLAMVGAMVHRPTAVLSILFAKSGTIINPILYIFLNKQVNQKIYCFHI